jgi:hypothetical protein
MKTFLQGVKRWYLRRFRGYVAQPRDPFGVSRGTAWQEHENTYGFTCTCKWQHMWEEADLVIREQDHKADCQAQFESQPVMGKCSCPITDARYVKICPQCGLGHWKVAA